MKEFISISIKLDWKNLVPKIAPKDCALFLRDNANYTFFWGNSNEFLCTNEFSFAEFEQFAKTTHGEHTFGYLGYDIKNAVEPNLSSGNQDNLNLPLAHFATAQHAVHTINGRSFYQGLMDPEEISELLKRPTATPPQNEPIKLEPSTSKEDYLIQLKAIQEKIQRGDIYETNFCVAFEAQSSQFSGFEAFKDLMSISDAPFSVYLSMGTAEVISASPERFIQKRSNELLSQPIKGTAPRATSTKLDNELKEQLQNDPKEIAENIMIVDLVRNDLSKVATKNSVHVDDLCALHSFKTVHQLISSVKCTAKSDTGISQVIQATFPMGSMTGAPKISAMKIAEEMENFKRGIYSGAIGLIHPNGNFDFNVVIRSIIHNKDNSQIAVPVGGAITIKSEPEKEYQECLTKLRAIQEVLC